jgi:hypothetical protein
MRSDAVAYDGSAEISARCNNRAIAQGILPLGSSPRPDHQPRASRFLSCFLSGRVGEGATFSLRQPVQAASRAKHSWWSVERVD